MLEGAKKLFAPAENIWLVINIICMYISRENMYMTSVENFCKLFTLV